jgi:hypothetical protein
MQNSNSTDSNSQKGTKTIGARVTEDLYNKVSEWAKAEGCKTVTEWLLKKINASGNNDELISLQAENQRLKQMLAKLIL